MTKLWGGRFATKTDALVHRFNASISFDVRLYDEDITGSVAWAGALRDAGLLNAAEHATLVDGLERVRAEFVAGQFAVQPGDEDIHSAVERRLTELVGPVGGKLHTGRSRNDQVATDFRLWIMRAGAQLDAHLIALQRALADSAAAALNLPMPGYTHLQHAQPVTWGHWALAHFWPLARDRARLAAVGRSAAVLPLGAGALAGTAFPVDRARLAERLGFAAVTANSLDAVSDRDFAAEFLFAAALLGVHLSRLAEQLILFSSAEFGFVRLSDAYSTGSSLMPQKKNPDPLELTRGKSGRLIGHLTGFLATLKGLPSSYDKDLQEDKEPVFDAFDTLDLALPVMAGLIGSLELRPERLAAQLEAGLLATELADYLARHGVPFRAAHHLVGQAVRLAEERGLPLTGLSPSDLQALSPHFAADAGDGLTIEAALAARATIGGTAPAALAAQLAAAREEMNRLSYGRDGSAPYQQAQALAALEERRRLAQNLHDAVNQSLFSASLIAEVLPRLWEQHPEEVQGSLEDLRRLTRGALAEMRGLLVELQPLELGDHELDDLVRLLGDALTGRTNIPVTVTTSGQGTLPAEVQIAFYRLCQEALNNVAKHSGAGQVAIRLQYEGGAVALSIRDNGRGFDPEQIPSGHYGLSIMQERATAIGATLSIMSQPGQGAEIVIRWAQTLE